MRIVLSLLNFATKYKTFSSSSFCVFRWKRENEKTSKARIHVAYQQSLAKESACIWYLLTCRNMFVERLKHDRSLDHNRSLRGDGEGCNISVYRELRGIIERRTILSFRNTGPLRLGRRDVPCTAEDICVKNKNNNKKKPLTCVDESSHSAPLVRRDPFGEQSVSARNYWALEKENKQKRKINVTIVQTAIRVYFGRSKNGRDGQWVRG